jgi:integrase
VLNGEEVTSLLACVKSLRHRTFLLTLYAAGMRLSEAAAALTIADIDSQRMQLRIALGGPTTPDWMPEAQDASSSALDEDWMLRSKSHPHNEASWCCVTQPSWLCHPRSSDGI